MTKFNDTTASNVGIIHLSDIHFSSESGSIQQKLEFLYRALKDDFLNCLVVNIVVSGDIANSGKKQEYEVAQIFFGELLKLLRVRYTSSTEFVLIFIPGNHDCNFDLDTQARKNALTDVRYETLGTDDSVFRICAHVQTDFWDFYNSVFGSVPENKLYYQIVETVKDKKLCFHCFNSAWMSQKDEKPGTLFFPVSHYKTTETINDFDLNIAVLHHPLNWFNPSTKENNKKEVQRLLEDISSLQIIGHEHENELRKTENVDSKDSQTLWSSGDILQDQKDPEKSGFQTFLINLNTNQLRLRRYQWKQGIYQRYDENEITLNKKKRRVIEASNTFIEYLDKIKLPLTLDDKQARFSDIYVFPDLELLSSKSENIINDYVDSETLLYSNKTKHCILEGESQIGKSSLLHMLFLKYYEKGYYPILLQGNNIGLEDIDKIVKKAFKTQYSEDPTDYDKFRQLDNDLKVLLIDDLHTSKLIKSVREDVINKFFDLFPRAFITIDTAYSLLPQSKIEFGVNPIG